VHLGNDRRIIMRKIFESLGEIHGLSWVLTIVLDLIWNIPDVTAFCSIEGIPAIPLLSLTIFIICFVIVTLVQRFVSEDEWEKAVTKGVVMGALAAVPFSIVTFVGRSIYKSVQRLFEATQVGSVLIPWREFEQLAKAKAIALGFPVPPGNKIKIAKVITFLVAKGVIAKSDKVALDAIREGRDHTVHYDTPEMVQELIAQSEKLLQKYIEVLR